MDMDSDEIYCSYDGTAACWCPKCVRQSEETAAFYAWEYRLYSGRDGDNNLIDVRTGERV